MSKLKKSNAVRELMDNDPAAKKTRAWFERKEPAYVLEFDRNWQEITDRNVQFWRDRENEQMR